MFNRVGNLENNVQGIIFSLILRIEVWTFERDFWTPISPSERKVISECFVHPAAQCQEAKHGGFARIYREFKLSGNREETSERLTIQSICCYGTLQKFSAPPVGGADSNRARISWNRIPKGQKFYLNDFYGAALKNLHFPKGQFSIEEIPIPRGP